MKKFIRHLLNNWAEIVIGILILFCVNDIRWFFLYCFVVLILILERIAGNLRKDALTIKIFNDLHLKRIALKLDIKGDENDEAMKECEAELARHKWNEDF